MRTRLQAGWQRQNGLRCPAGTMKAGSAAGATVGDEACVRHACPWVRSADSTSWLAAHPSSRISCYGPRSCVASIASVSARVHAAAPPRRRQGVASLGSKTVAIHVNAKPPTLKLVDSSPPDVRACLPGQNKRGGEFLAQWPTNNLKAARHERAVTDSNDSGGASPAAPAAQA